MPPFLHRFLGATIAGLTAIGLSAAAEPTALGTEACLPCHAEQASRWRGSHHDLAMGEASEAMVRGDFDEASFIAHGITSTFFRRDGRYFVRTDGPDGALTDYRIRYTFGWWPLQQYLIAFPGGRLQALGIAWDSRSAELGGQRWFHLYAEEEGMDHRHPLHWTGREQTWNHQCADCHSTGLRKGYDLATDRYDTTWSDINVACEACHGPGSDHVEQARAAEIHGPQAWRPGKGLAVRLTAHDEGHWSLDPQAGVPVRSVPLTDRTEIEICARCHARRGPIHASERPGAPMTDHYRPALLEAGLYHADGQIQDEVFEYGSFIQSRMYRAGVTCADCHDPHSLELVAPGNALCTRCHQIQRYDTPTHHHHPPASTGAACVACHMPQRRYMQVDDRADHSLRIPRPDLTVRLGTPNACNQCHAERSAQWAADALAEWRGPVRWLPAHFGEILHAGRHGQVDAGQELWELALDNTQPGIARATALTLLSDLPDGTRLNDRLDDLAALLADPDPLVRAAAVRRLEVVDPASRLRFGLPLLEDPVRLVRLDAALTLASLLRLDPPEAVRVRLAAGVSAYRAAQRVVGDRPESHHNLGLIETAIGDIRAAEAAYRDALRLAPDFAPAYVNLADLYRLGGQDDQGEQVLRQGIAAVPDDPDLHYALGLLYARTNRLAAAVEALTQAARLAPERPRLADVHALALEELERQLRQSGSRRE
ncbi:cytochrome c3 family protein [Thioalkalicoccus limnaeus]|uniref:Cytochrome c3 family protein n=1 Tax=Thioalkalicoccus limnaeus TaxID=120681 RepID=A0ABV4B960_9GAMM